MQDETPSRTALGTAYMRAAHQLVDPPPLLFEDPVAVRLLGENTAEVIRGHSERHQSKGGRALRCHVCLRARVAEDRLREAVSRGVTRYVIAGAGFDTFAWRRPSWAAGLAILEVDHPATQARKRELLAKANLAEPENFSFVPADFTRETLAEVLAKNGAGAGEKVYFSWLGVSMYLEEAAIDATLKAMAAFAPGSGVTLTFLTPLKPSTGAQRLSDRVSELGEAFVSFFTPTAMAEKLKACGFPDADFLTPQKAQALYFAAGGLNAPSKTSIVTAWK